MDSKKFLQIMGMAFVLVFVIGMVALTISPGTSADVIPNEESKELRTISVSATNEVSAKPNKVEVYFSVETNANNAKTSQSNNAEISAKVIEALKAIGIKETEIETTGYYLNENWEWNGQKSIRSGYKTTHSLKVSVMDTGKAGDIIDSAVQAGATSVSNIVFTVDNDTMEKLRIQALEMAAGKATEKAQAMAKGLGVQLGVVQNASENSSYYMPVNRVYSMDSMVKAESVGASTDIMAGEIKVSATVSAVYLIK
ncbi:MAG: SIMPL domain-containing protein [Candidatus Diapherotrites archaeon]|nr:SIMPL domain-containing protein [Candidatus Diapherotrites archaeon]